MRASTFATLTAALGLSVVGGAAALADGYRGPLESVDTTRGTIRVMGVTIQADGYPIADLDPSADYVVTWDDRGGQNVLTDVRPMRRN